MEFKDRRLSTPKIDTRGRKSTDYALEMLASDKAEDSLIRDAMASLALNLIVNNSESVGPIKAHILLNYLENRDKNPGRITLSYEDARRFAELLRLSSRITLGEVAGAQAMMLANEIEEVVLTRSFQRQLNLNTIEDLLQ
jgi:hypothetical protein